MSEETRGVRLGAFFEGEEVVFRLWAPERRRASVSLFDDTGERVRRVLEMDPEPGDVFVARVARPRDGGRVLYKLTVDGEGPFPDPYARAQPFGVHGPSEVIDHGAFAWRTTSWKAPSIDELVVYELHVGTATPEGTFEALIGRLEELAELGVTAIELMPVASFPGQRNWGYDGVSLYAPQASYGGPEGLKRLVDAAHARGLAVLIDAVYNHLGPDGNYLGCYSRRYFTNRHKTPWGDALNLDGEGAALVRRFLIDNAVMWIRDYRVDGLRLDATHAIIDDSEPHILRVIADEARAAGAGRRVLVIAEDDRNEARLVRPVAEGGYGLDAVWADDFHHQMRRAFAGDHDGYYEDFSGSAEDIAATLNRGWLYEGQVSKHHGGPRGTRAAELPPPAFVHCIQNHDQIGNRAFGDRLGESVSAAAYRAMSALLLASPYTPLLFMGQEWNATTPFLYFTDHEPDLGRAVTEGRRREFARFASFGDATQIPDPQAEATFARSKLDLAERSAPAHAAVRALYRELLRLRASKPSLLARGRGSFEARAIGEDALVLERRGAGQVMAIVMNMRGSLEHALAPAQTWRLVLCTEEPRFGGAVDLARVLDGNIVRLEGPAVAFVERDES